jgi:hypothetical protein
VYAFYSLILAEFGRAFMLMPDYAEFSTNKIGGMCSPIERRLPILIFQNAA